MKWKWHYLLLLLVAAMMAAIIWLPALNKLIAGLAVLLGAAWIYCDTQAEKCMALTEQGVAKAADLFVLVLALSFGWGAAWCYGVGLPHEWQAFIGGVVGTIVFFLFFMLFLVSYDSMEEKQEQQMVRALVVQ